MMKFIRALFAIATVVFIPVYLLACCTPYINPITFWPMTFMALAFPFLALALLLLVISWLFINKRISVCLVLILLVGYKNLYATFALNLPRSFNYSKNPNQLRILSWNVRYFDNNATHADGPSSIRRRMMNYINKVNADILLLQDYTNYEGEPLFSNDKTLRDSLGYKYYYTSKDFVGQYSYGQSETGVAIFSKFPVVDSGKINFTVYDESIATVDVLYNNKKIRVFTTHLASMGIHGTKKYLLNRDKHDSALVVTKKVSRTLKNYDQIHVQQAEQLRSEISKSPYPVIVTGDYNSVPSSYVYHTIKGNLLDVFSERGFGIGRTYTSLTRTLRIDYIFVDRSFKVLQTASPQLFLSDHFPVIADVELK